jgi:putative oxidoreductase
VHEHVHEHGMAANAQVRWGATLLRVAVASVFVVHGIARMSAGTVSNFGAFLSGWGLPAGEAIAWTLTLVEIAGGLLLALGLAVRPLAVWFAAQILMGIVMIHARAGWFVVGAGRNGVEYSVLILAALLAAFLTDSVTCRVRR